MGRAGDRTRRSARVRRPRVLGTLAVISLAAVLIVVMMRRPIARWALCRALESRGLAPVTFAVREVGFTSLELAGLSVGPGAWLEADAARVTYSPAGLLRGQARALEVRGARWIISTKEGRWDWGYPASTSGGPVGVALPVEHIDASASAIELHSGDGVTVIPVAARLRRSGTGFDLEGDARAAGRRLSVSARVRADGSALTVVLRAAAASDAAGAGPVPPPSTLDATITRAQDTGAVRIEGAADVWALGEHVGGVVLGAGRAQISGEAGFGPGWAMESADVSVQGREVVAGAVRLDEVSLRADAAGPATLALIGSAAGAGWEAPRVSGSVAWSGGVVSASLHAGEPVVIDDPETGVTGELGEVRAEVALSPWTSPPTATGSVAIAQGEVRYGELGITGGRLEAELHYPDRVDVRALSAIVGDGGTVRAEPFSIDLASLSAATVVAVRNLSLAEWLPLLTGDRASGEGRVSGEVTVGASYGARGLALGTLRGALRADPPRGTIRVRDGEAVAGLLERQDPRFSTDPTMAGVRDRVVDALRDFAFTALRVDLSRRGDRTAAVAYLSGFGRNGEDPQGINLTLDLQADDAALGLVTRMASRARLRKETGEALDRFFEGGKP